MDNSSPIMPGLSNNVLVTLTEILEVKDRPLEEWELWGLLYKTIEAVQDLFFRGQAFSDGEPLFLVTPDNLMCTAAGHITLKNCSPSNINGTKYWCPQMKVSECHPHNENLEMVYVFTIGQTMIHAAYYLDKTNMELSPLIKTVLQAMCQIEDNQQMSLTDVAEVCTLHATKYMCGNSFSNSVVSLYEDVLGGAWQGKRQNKINFVVATDDDENLNNCNEEVFQTFPKLKFHANNLRRGCHPSLPKSHSHSKSIMLPTPKERWKKAFNKIIKKIRNSTLTLEKEHHMMERWKHHKTHLPILEIYEKLTERWKILELLKLSVNVEPFVPEDIFKNAFRTAGLKPKTLTELVMLLQCTAKQLAIDSATKSYESISRQDDIKTYVSNSLIDKPIQNNFIGMRPYYQIDKLALETSCFSKNNSIQKKSFLGPEFVIGRLKPHSKLTLFTSDQKEDDFMKSTFSVIVTLLNGEHVDIECSRSITGKLIYQALAHHMKLQEQYLFGLTYCEGGECIFIERKQKVVDLLNSNCESLPRFGSVIELNFHVKFYLDDIHLMRNQYLRHLYYLQLRKNFLDDNFACDPSIALALGGLVLQAEFGNYNFEEFGENYFLVEHYLSLPVINQYGRDKVKFELINQHASYKRISSELAELKFIQEMIKTPEYGYHFHQVSQDKENPASVTWLGICSKGVDIFESISGRRKLRQNFPWQDIQRISFTKKYFCLAPKVENHSKKHSVCRFFTPILHRSHYLFTTSMSHHKFYLKLKSITKPSQLFIDGIELNHCCEEVSSDSRLEKEVGCDLLEEDPFASNSHTSTDHIIETGLGNPPILLQLRTSYSGEQRKKRAASRFVTRSASAPESLKISILLRTSNSTSAKDPHVRISSTMPRTTCKKQEIKIVRLLKDQDRGLGMVVTCGNTYETVLHGAFVEAVTPGGPVDLEGNISAGDQILSVNGTDVQNHNFLDVVDLLKCSNSPVELVIEKSNRNQICPSYYLEKEIEPLFTKTESWITDSIHSKDTMVIDQKNNNEDSFCEEDVPIPKPRKKWIEREKLNFNFPDLTLNHATAANLNTSWESEDSPNMRENSNIPDIIPSQKKGVDAPHQETHCENYVPSVNFGIKQNGTGLGLHHLPAELYHVVLDKKGGTLGLNIYQGIEPSCPLQRNIYIHSTIPGGAAELNGKIMSGDKLLKVNGTSLENLSYQEVVTKLRESPQVVHLVLERRCLIPDKTLNSDSNTENNNVQPFLTVSPDSYIPMSPKTQKEIYVPMTFNLQNAFSASSTSLLSNGADTTKNGSLKHDLVSEADSTYAQEYSAGSLDNSCSSSSSMSFKHADLESHNSYSTNSLSMPSPDGMDTTKEIFSAPSSYQHVEENSKPCKKSNSDVDCPKITHSDEDFSTSPNAKGPNVRCSLTSYKSTPNLADNSDDEENNQLSVERSLQRNSRSTDCLLSSPYFLNPHLALIDLYHNYTFVRDSSSDVGQIPKVPIRKKKLRKLEDVYNFCNQENTFTVDIRKSSRGLGISISGGRERDSKDSFSQLIRIRKLYPLQPALECGKLQLGDVILEVNGTNMIGLSNTEALEVLRCAPPDVNLKVFRPSKSLIPSFSMYKDGSWPFVDSSSSSTSSSLSRCETKAYNIETGEFEITLMKREGSLGFTIFQHDENSVDDTPAGIYIKALIREPAVTDGRIHPGDRILKVNGICISSMSHMEAIAFIRNAPITVVLNMYRMDPPLSPAYLEDDHHTSKPLRWEAQELINDRGKEKENGDDCNTLKRKLNRKLDRTSHAPSVSSAESESASSTSSGQEYVINENEVVDNPVDDCPGLQRNQRPKSLDVLNSSDRKRLNLETREESFHRQASVMCPDAKGKTEAEESGVDGSSKTGGETLLKWRGTTMTPEEAAGDLSKFATSCESSLNSCDEQMTFNEVEEEEEKPVPLPRTTSAVSNEWVQTLNVVLDRGWHGRLGFSLYDAPPESSKKLLPAAAEVKAVHSGSLADKDGRIKIGDRLIEVNHKSLLGKSSVEVIDILRKTRGVIRMVLCRLKTES